MYDSESEGELSAKEKAFARFDVRLELEKWERLIEELKVQFEQYFTGILPLAPDPLHNEVKRQRRELLKAPFKNSETNFRFRTIETRYNTYRSYWERVMREREAGTYQRDVFKANLRERIAHEEQMSKTAQGQAKNHMAELFASYKSALEKESGKKVNVEYDTFRKMIVQRAKDFKEQNGSSKLTFKVVVKDGKVSIQAKAKN